MPFPMKIQPIDFRMRPEDTSRFEAVKPLAKSRLKRLFERPFTNVLRSSAAAEKGGGGIVIEEQHSNKDGFGSGGGSGEFEPSSVCLEKMVQSYMEETNEKQSAVARCTRNRCNCFNGNCNDSSEDELEAFGSFGDSNLAASGEACELIKGLASCQSVSERNLLADTAKIVEKNKVCKRKDDMCRTVVTDHLLALGYDAWVCNSRWEKTPSYPAGEYGYIDVIVKGERLLIDIDFRSEFEIARPTKSYKAILQTLPYIFVGKPDRLWRIIAIVSEAAKQSLKKKGMHIPPWRKAEYIKAKWLSPHTRASSSPSDPMTEEKFQPLIETGEFEMCQDMTNSVGETELEESVFKLSESSGEEEKGIVAGPPELKPKRSQACICLYGGEDEQQNSMLKTERELITDPCCLGSCSEILSQRHVSVMPKVSTQTFSGKRRWHSLPPYGS